jgi:hypothetical protein
MGLECENTDRQTVRSTDRSAERRIRRDINTKTVPHGENMGQKMDVRSMTVTHIALFQYPLC